MKPFIPVTRVQSCWDWHVENACFGQFINFARSKGLGMKKDLLTVKELASELRMSVKSIQGAYRKEEIPVRRNKEVGRLF